MAGLWSSACATFVQLTIRQFHRTETLLSTQELEEHFKKTIADACYGRAGSALIYDTFWRSTCAHRGVCTYYED